jgi:uncharacterized membrane protein YphA (DoxX/SURF4 family)
LKAALSLLKRILASRYFNTGIRTAIGVVLLMSGIGKLTGGHEIVSVVASLNVLPYPLIQPTLTVLPWLEIVMGTLFILGLFSRLVAALSLPLFAAFIVTNIFNLQRGLTEPCTQCFGNLLVLTARDALIIDMLLLLAALRVVSLEGPAISLDSLRTRKQHPA